MKFLSLALLCLLPSFAFAHKGHHHEALTATASAVASSSVSGTAGAAPKIDWPALFRASSKSHLHNKVVHFPIALGLVGILFFILSMKFESLRGASRWLLFLAALSTVATIITGARQEDDVEGAALKQVFEVHETLGWGVAIGLWAVWLLSFAQSTYKWLWLLLILLAAAIVAEGNLGGVLAHMQL